MIKIVFIKMAGYSAEFMKEACNVIESALQAQFKERIRVITMDEEITFLNLDQVIKMLQKLKEENNIE